MLNLNPGGVTDSESWLAPETGTGSRSYSLACDFLSDVAAMASDSTAGSR